jgi:phospholipid-binding lipoprotein MlaA
MIQFKRFTLLCAALILTAFLIGCSQQSVEKTEPPATLAADNPSSPEKIVATEADDEDAELDEDDEMDEFETEFEEAKIEVYDPFGGYNRAMTTFNDTLFLWVLTPISQGYAYVVPEAPRSGISNFFTNLLYPIRVVNNLLQFKLKNAGEETLRFVTNTTIGILGFWDPAREWFGLEAHDEDFGQTLGYYGIGAGPHIVLPFFGPSNLRDALSKIPDNFLDPVGQERPIGQTDNYVTEYGVRAYDVTNEISLRPGEYESLKKDALDFYPFLRDSYEQMRNKQIKE